MPKIKLIELPAEFQYLKSYAQKLDADNDCAVKAVALLCDQDYQKVFLDMKAAGREDNKGTQWTIIRSMFSKYGYALKRVHITDIIASYPKPHCNVLKNFTTHHPRRFPGCLDPNKRYLLDCNRHVAAVLGGEVKDWSINRALRAIAIFEVQKID